MPGICLRRWTARDLSGWHMQAAGVAVLLAALALLLTLACLAQNCRVQPLTVSFSWREVLLLILQVPAHEGVHWVAARALGYRPRLGLQFPGGWPLPYATTNASLPPMQAVAFLLAPFMVLTLGMLPLLWTPWVGPAAVLSIINAAGSTGDLWMAWGIWRLVRERAPGTRILVTETAAETAIWRLPDNSV